MKNIKPVLILFSIVTVLAAFACNNSNSSAGSSGEPWTAKQLMEPSELNKILNDANAQKPLIFSIGFGGGIPGSVEMGAARDEVNLEKFKAALSKLPKDKPVVIYCGCCPFEHCPNVRPAFKLMNDMGFTNQKLLNLKQNFKTDWIDKGYPVTN